MLIEKSVILITLLLWPVSLYLANTPGDFMSYAIPSVLLLISFFLRLKSPKLRYLPVLLIPLSQPKLALFPILYIIFDYLFIKKEKYKLVLLLLGVLMLFSNWNSFHSQTIFTKDYEAGQNVIRNTHLYNNIFTARLFHNKFRIPLDKFNNNFFALIDPNNYFFGFAPRQIVENQNLVKFPFPAIFLLVIGIFYLNTDKNIKFVIVSFLSGVLSLSILKIFDRNDFILFLPLSLVLTSGIKQVQNIKYSKVYFIIYLLFAVTELIRVLIIYRI